MNIIDGKIYHLRGDTADFSITVTINFSNVTQYGIRQVFAE